ncbi:hypothetical protein HYS00_02450 [Candidatus Microgenomates bacterium]|nr:hypothetical protein [Candidatus Microgenomates bacterium]
MRRKTLLWLLLFVFLIIANLAITMTYVKKVKRLQAASVILDEIESGYPANDQFAQSAKPEAAGEIQEQVDIADSRVANLKRFLRRYNSPLYEHAEFIVQTADKNNMDYRLLPAIAMQESGLCAKIPVNSHNCWGWGIYGNTITRFADYEEAIDTVSRGLKKYYIDRGPVTASQIMSKYNPGSPGGSWANSVNRFIDALE